MAFTAYEYYGEVNGSVPFSTTSFYEEPGLTTYAFTTGDAYTDPFSEGDCTCFFDVALEFGGFATDVTFYASGGRQLTPSAGTSLIGTYVNGIDSSEISGIGAYTSASGDYCYYVGAIGAGLHTPSLDGYTFTPASDTATNAIGRLVFVAAVEEEPEPDPPDKATNPSPANTVTGVSTNVSELSWTQGNGADTEAVYFGLTGAMALVQTGAGTTFDLSSYLPLPFATSYQWRIDSINDDGTTTGDVWSFTTTVLAPPNPQAAAAAAGAGSVYQVIKRLCATAKHSFWYEDI